MESASSLVFLLNRARAGDHDARDRLFERCRKYVGVVARAELETWLQTKVDASDLVQQTLLDAHRGFAEFRGTTDAEWLAWLRRILSHNATDIVRHYHGTQKRQLGRERPLQTEAADALSRRVGNDPVDPGETPSQVLMRHEQEVLMAEAIAELTHDYQEVIMLRNLQRLPFEEVASRMGRSRPAVQMLWLRAIRALQDRMKTQES